jgi:hypothetical protein
MMVSESLPKDTREFFVRLEPHRQWHILIDARMRQGIN